MKTQQTLQIHLVFKDRDPQVKPVELAIIAPKKLVKAAISRLIWFLMRIRNQRRGKENNKMQNLNVQIHVEIRKNKLRLL